ncbi:hypothetical protein KCM76_00780 [Zooshikella marina]|uniref:hypothetical protein n=1 Tax=Zooshikella ganghwensis TaxID=202772 RepID=UPI001BAFE838|nr:hypothetical protein [Zooshikella ganghwensis]MBU2704495.1 hypothetical protein [Zooshikella ganghwensis]
MKKYFYLAISLVLFTLTTVSSAKENNIEGKIKLEYSNGQTATEGLEEVNLILRSVGVRVSNLPLPKDAKPILKASQNRAITKAEANQLISYFSLHRGELLEQIKLAGRTPEGHHGGYLSTSEESQAPYPKVYDMKTLTPKTRAFIQSKLGKLHVNSSDNGMGIDEVMTIVSGGPWTWFVALPNNIVGKLTLSAVGLKGKAWRISYPGLVPHGGYFDTEQGLIVAYAHGPKNFVMRYEEPSVAGAELLNNNPWIDFTGKMPKLLNKVK